MPVIGPKFFVLSLALVAAAQPAWAQTPAGETDAAFYSRMLEQAETINRDLTVSRERLTKVVAELREEVTQLKSDRDKFDAEYGATTVLLLSKHTQWQQLKAQASKFYLESRVHLDILTKLQYEQARTLDRPKEGTP